MNMKRYNYRQFPGFTGLKAALTLVAFPQVYSQFLMIVLVPCYRCGTALGAYRTLQLWFLINYAKKLGRLIILCAVIKSIPNMVQIAVCFFCVFEQKTALFLELCGISVAEIAGILLIWAKFF